MCGDSLVSDCTLQKELQRVFSVSNCRPLADLLPTAKEKRAALVLLEIGAEGEVYQALRKLREKYATVAVISVGEYLATEKVAEAFQYGARDFFRIPYKTRLVVERVTSLARQKAN